MTQRCPKCCLTLCHSYDKALPLSRGQELNVTCTFNTMSRTEVTTSGAATSEEMCYTFLFYYPKQALTDSMCRVYNYMCNVCTTICPLEFFY